MDSNIKVFLTDSSVFGCSICECVFLKINQPIFCPICGKAGVHLIENKIEFPDIELVMPHHKDGSDYEKKINDFIASVKFKPEQLNISNLKQNAQWVFIPVWMVDSLVDGNWEANFGFDYLVDSSIEKHQFGEWQTINTKETRTDWEERIGTFKKGYQNVTTSSHTRYHQLIGLFGDYQLLRYNNYPNNFHFSNEVVLILPDIDKNNGWPLARDEIIKLANKDCEKASGAQHTKSFTPTFNYNDQLWTLLLLPYMVTSYHDDYSSIHSIWINGQTLQINGDRYSSKIKGNKLGFLYLIVSFLGFILTLLLGFLGQNIEILVFLAIISLLTTIGFFIGSMFCFTYPSNWNKKNTEKFKI